jgi:hypothetical protein
MLNFLSKLSRTKAMAGRIVERRNELSVLQRAIDCVYFIDLPAELTT